jgi:hypothetical protein
MEIITQALNLDNLKQIAARTFGDMVKAVVDVDREILALDAELHCDLEALLLENGSRQHYLWGVNLYPGLEGNAFIEFDSMINMRPSCDNRSRGVDDPKIRSKIIEIIDKKIKR